MAQRITNSGHTRRRRVWCEFLTPNEIGDQKTVKLLAKYEIELLVALPPTSETSEMIESLVRVAKAGVRVGLWPLLEDAEGYWPSESNVDSFVSRVDRAMSFVDQANLSVSTLAFDLEPPLPVTQRLFSGTAFDRAKIIIAGMRSTHTETRTEERKNATSRLAALEHRLRERGIETLVAIIPPMVLDIAARTMLWQNVFRTPFEAVNWSKISPLMYTSALAPLFPGRSLGAARALLQETALVLRTAFGDRTCLSLGCVGHGKLGDEAVYAAPEELAQDVAIAVSSGVDDLALFALDGVLGTASPESWLDAFVASAPLSKHSAPPAIYRMMARSLTLGTSLLSTMVANNRIE